MRFLPGVRPKKPLNKSLRSVSLPLDLLFLSASAIIRIANLCRADFFIKSDFAPIRPKKQQFRGRRFKKERQQLSFFRKSLAVQ